MDQRMQSSHNGGAHIKSTVLTPNTAKLKDQIHSFISLCMLPLGFPFRSVLHPKTFNRYRLKSYDLLEEEAASSKSRVQNTNQITQRDEKQQNKKPKDQTNSSAFYIGHCHILS